MGSSYSQVYVRCPFYRGDDGKRRINCEGLIEKSCTAQIYQRREDFQNQMSIFCCEQYKKCEIYRMIMGAKYED